MWKLKMLSRPSVLTKYILQEYSPIQANSNPYGLEGKKKLLMKPLGDTKVFSTIFCTEFLGNLKSVFGIL